MADIEREIKEAYKKKAEEDFGEKEEEEEEETNEDQWDDWTADDDDAEFGKDESNSNLLLCLFCDSKFGSSRRLFDHCRLAHKFDFQLVSKELVLDFYTSLKFINYVRSQVAENRCWSCRLTCQSNQDLLDHLHEAPNLKDIKHFLSGDEFLKPFMQNDSLLYSFNEDEEYEDDLIESVDKEELLRELGNIKEICISNDSTEGSFAISSDKFQENGMEEMASTNNGCVDMASSSSIEMVNGMGSRALAKSSDVTSIDKHSKASVMNLVARDIKKVNDNYFGAYSSFGIHREMLSDKVRMDAYSRAILENRSLLSNAVVMDVGCGTGILSLFAAQAGASRVVAVEASEKMAAVATQIAKDNGLWRGNSQVEGNNQHTGVIEVVQGMVEDLDKFTQIEPHSIDVLLSEWMGYCLLYESMLSSVLYARDKWLKPGGAILPDTATIYAAGFGRGGTSLPFWENVYGFNMSSVGRELAHDAAKFPIVDVVNESDIVTDAVVLQTFDMANMRPDEVDFTSTIELKPKLGRTSDPIEFASGITWCYGVVLWFDTGFNARFCKERPAVLSTSPYTPKTHWSQTIFTFQEPIAIASGKLCADKSAAVGTEAFPASRVHLRVSIARAAEHRSIDISLETTGISADGKKSYWPVQMFTLS